MNEIEGKKGKMVGNNRGPFGSQCTNCGFLGCRELGVWCVSILNLQYGGWQVCIQDSDKSPTKPVCHKRCHCQSSYWTFWKGSVYVYHKTCSSELCDFLSLRSISYSFSNCSLFHFNSSLPSEVGTKFAVLKLQFHASSYFGNKQEDLRRITVSQEAECKEGDGEYSWYYSCIKFPLQVA
jgi:hypothetical protein